MGTAHKWDERKYWEREMEMKKSSMIIWVMVVIFLGVISSAQAGQIGTVVSYQKISDTQGNFTGTLKDYGSFGRSIASIADLNGDGKVNILDLSIILSEWGK